MTALPLAGPLALLLPDRRQTLLLRGALGAPGVARAAIGTWQAETAAPTRDLGSGAAGGQLLAPILARNLADSGASLDPRLWTYLRTARVREEIRAGAARRITGEALRALAGAGLTGILLGGLAASETVYPEPTLRHSHDVDLLVDPEALEPAIRALGTAGFRPDPAAAPGGGSRGLVHPSGFPLALHAELFRVPLHRRAPEPVLARTRSVTLLGQPARILAPADQLLHLLVHAAGAGSRASLLWACDAWLTLRAEPDLDWDGVVGETVARRAALPVAILLDYLGRELGAPVPAPALEALRRAASRATRVEREVALWGAWTTAAARLPTALGLAAGPAEAAFLLRWRLLPAPDGLTAAARVPAGRARLPYYLWRPWRLLARGAGRLAIAPARAGAARTP